MTTGENNESSLPEPTTNSDQKSTPSQLVTALQREHADWITEVIEAHGEVTAIVPAQHIVDVCAALKAGADARFDFLADLCGGDRGVEEEPRFEVNYHLFSTTIASPAEVKGFTQRSERACAYRHRSVAHGKLARARNV